MYEANDLRDTLCCVAAVIGPIAGALFAYFKLPKRVGLISVLAVFATAWSGVAFGAEFCDHFGLFGNTFGWGGWGGSLVMIDPDARMVVAYVTNQMREPGDDTRGLELVMSAYDGIQGLGAR